MKKIGLLTSGGDAPGMNAAIRAVVRTCSKFGVTCIGIRSGYNGLVEGDFIELDRDDVSNIIQKGGTILYSARSEAFRTIEGRRIAASHLQREGIDGIIVIGGDGTFKGAHVFYQEHNVPIIGLPGTIDNDLYGTDYTIGYDTAINTAMEAIDKIKDTATAHHRLFFIEVMGRDAGFIALRAGIATGAEAVLIPEKNTDLDQLVEVLQAKVENKKNSAIVIVAEGDDAGGAMHIADMVSPRLKGYDIRVSVLGHIQRGGSPTCMERVRASRLGYEAVHAILSGEKDCMVGMVKREVTLTPFAQAIKHHQDVEPNMLALIDTLL